MRSVCTRKLASIAIIIVTIWTSITGCGSDKRDDLEPASEISATNGAEQTVNVLVPTGVKALIKGITAIAEASGLPYTFQILEGDIYEASVRAMLDGKIDLLFVMRQPLPDERTMFLELFRTSVVIFANAEIGIDTLSHEQAVAIFSGEATNWSQVGGPNMEITVFIQEDNATTTIALREYLFATTTFTESAQVLISDKDIISVVDGMPGAIGYSSWAAKKLQETTASDASAVSVRLDGLFPDDPDYPIVGPVGFVYLPERQVSLQPILDWAISFIDSDMGQLLLEQYGLSAGEPKGRDSAHLD